VIIAVTAVVHGSHYVVGACDNVCVCHVVIGISHIS
jgi:hypothetical protein